jgi:hypothetical protein
VAEKPSGEVAKVRKDYEEDKRHHDAWAQKVDRWYKSYRGEYLDSRQASEWRSDVHPPYLLQIVETLCSGLSDPNPRWDVKPRPKAADAEQIERLREGAKQLGLLLSYQREVDGMVLKQRLHRLQGLIAGLSVWKTYWRYEEVVKSETKDVVDYFGMPTGETEEIENRLPTKDDPCVDVVDVRDFIWPESATSLENAPRLHHRVYMTYEKLSKVPYFSNFESLKTTEEASSGEDSGREQETHEADRTKGRIEVIEHWVDYGKRVVTIANGSVLLSDRPNPFEHGKYPFIACAPIPDLFRIPGISIIELVEDLQRMVWQLQRQSLDNLEIINNVIILNPQDGLMEDRIFAPGEQWLVEAKDNAPMALELPIYPVEVAMGTIQGIKADIQGIPGASPALLGQTDSVEQTATEVSLMANLAQRRLAGQKQQFTIADVRVAEQWIELNRQFLDEKRYVAVVGKDGDEAWELINPDAFSEGQFSISIEQMDESLIRQERLAEAQARLQVALTAVGPMAAIGQPLNMRAFVDDVLEAAGVQDKDRYYSATPQPGGAMQGQPQQPPAPGPPSPGGVTSPMATDMNSPSNEFSQSPAAMMSRMLSQGGGPANA